MPAPQAPKKRGRKPKNQNQPSQNQPIINNSANPIFDLGLYIPHDLDIIQPLSLVEFEVTLNTISNNIEKLTYDIETHVEKNLKDDLQETILDFVNIYYNLCKYLLNKGIYARSNLKQYIADIYQNYKNTEEFQNGLTKLLLTF